MSSEYMTKIADKAKRSDIAAYNGYEKANYAGKFNSNRALRGENLLEKSHSKSCRRKD